MKKEEKFKINITGNSTFTLDILNQYKLKVSPRVKIESIAIDITSPNDAPTYITLLGKYLNQNNTYVNTLNIKDFNFTELADLVITMIKLYRPTSIKLDTNGIGRGLLDYLMIELKKDNIQYEDNGLLTYEYKEKEESNLNYKKVKDLLDFSIEYKMLAMLGSDCLRGYGKSKALDEKANELGVRVIRKYWNDLSDNTVITSELQTGRFKFGTQFLVDECVSYEDIKRIEKQGYLVIGGFHKIK